MMNKHYLLIMIILSAACLFGNFSSDEPVPADALDIDFTSSTSLIYNGRTYENIKDNDNPAYQWLYDSEYTTYYGKVKITHEVWGVGYGAKLNGYSDVKASFDDNGDVSLFDINFDTWVPEDCYESIFYAEFSGLYVKNRGTQVIDAFRLSDIADTDRCIPYNSDIGSRIESIDKKKDNVLLAYNNIF